ncbi:MAG: glycosyltransferase family 2 protein [Chloroflexota bacterium]|nr:glycosyltransferase family 2 protein [Chloroflexota bacterium]
MFVLNVLRGMLLVAEVCLAAPVLYLGIVSASALRAAKSRQAAYAQSRLSPLPMTRFAILVPAHDEDVTLGALLANLAQLDYPRNLYTVYVVADNCTDSTPDIVRASGVARVYERFDQARRGKGYALNWLLQKLAEDRLLYDAYVVIDADSIVDPAFLQAMAIEMGRGTQAMQAHNTVLNADASPSAALRWIALSLVNHVRSLGRSGLGASVALTGNGMCLSHAILQRYPWQAFSVGEDYEYYLALVAHGERVQYVPEAVVRSHMPTKFAQMRTQDIRWEAAQPVRKTWQTAWRLLSSGLRQRDFVRVEAFMELLVPPLSLLLSFCVLTLLAAIAVWSLPALLLALALVAGLACYISTALYLLRPSRSVYKALLYAPGFMLWKLWVYFVLRKNKKHASEWVRTSRTVSVP